MIIRNSRSGNCAAGYRQSNGRDIIAAYVPSGGGRTLRLELSIGAARGLVEAVQDALDDAEAQIVPYRPSRDRNDG